MGIRNTAKCRKCERTGPKCSMHKVMDGNFVVGYEHDDCSKFEHFSKDLTFDSIYDMNDKTTIREDMDTEDLSFSLEDIPEWF